MLRFTACNCAGAGFAPVHRSPWMRVLFPWRRLFACRGDGAYLVTGGLGGLGLLVARRLVERGARELLLWGRKPLPARDHWASSEHDAETLARISAIRGVNVDGVIRTLVTRGLIVEAGADPDTGGGLFRTTDFFLEKLGLESLEELPSLAPLLPELESLDTDEL